MNPEEVLTARAKARVGQTLHEKWHLDHLLGVGGMAAVYAATHRNGARAAIKILHLELSLDNEVRQRFLREGYAANAVGHPGVVRALDDDAADDSSVFLVMELLEGETLDERWERLGQRLPVDETLTVAEELLSILEAAHLRGIVHRDLKPENLFVTANGLKLLDFGIARVREGAAASATRTGMTAGTPAFMAPEQALGHSAAVGPRSDLWAVGALMFTMLTGRYVHEGQSANEIMIRTATRPAPAIKTVRDDLADEVAAVIDRALAFETEARWVSATEMREAVQQAREGGGMRTRSLAPPPLSAKGPDSDAIIIAPTSLRPGSESRILGPSSFSSESLTAGGVEATGGRRMVLPGLALGLALMGIVVTVALRSSSGLSSNGQATASATSVSAPVSALPVVASAGPAGSVAPVVVVAHAPTGRVRVKVKGGECEVLIAGEARGMTDKGGLEVDAPIGEQVVRCEIADNLSLTEIATVKSGEVAVVSFVHPRSLPRLATPSATAPVPVDPMDRRR